MPSKASRVLRSLPAGAISPQLPQARSPLVNDRRSNRSRKPNSSIDIDVRRRLRPRKARVRHLLENRQRFCVLIYQHHYNWDPRQVVAAVLERYTNLTAVTEETLRVLGFGARS